MRVFLILLVLFYEIRGAENCVFLLTMSRKKRLFFAYPFVVSCIDSVQYMYERDRIGSLGGVIFGSA